MNPQKEKSHHSGRLTRVKMYLCSAKHAPPYPRMKLPQDNDLTAHLLALLTVCIWGTTFISTKVLLLTGLTAAQIFLLRFVLAYLCILLFTRHRLLSGSLGDELVMAALGVTGGSLYFLTENQSLCTSPATNVSIIVCSCPLFTMLLYRVAVRGARLSWWQVAGSLVAFAGMLAVVCNGRFVLHLSPVGDALAFGACLCWAAYSLLIRKVGDRYSSLFITRKVFFYGLLTIIPYILWEGTAWPAATLLRPVVVANLLFLGIICSFACFLAWTYAMKRLGAVRCTNYVYLNPLTTLVFAAWILNEPITPYYLAGAAAIVAGLWMSDRKVR